MALLMITDFIGHFHPVLVHLPIGMLLLALLMQALSVQEKYVSLQSAIPVAYLAGFIGAIMSCITGWLLASKGEYDETTLDLHRWMGIGVAVISASGYFFLYQKNSLLVKISALLLFVLITITGHLGGTLTHGEGYLTNVISGSTKDSLFTPKIITNAQEALVYTDIIQPVLQQKCYNCHSQKKQKGGLRLDAEDWILKGGKDGLIVKAGNPESSDLYKRVILDPLEEKHMPPKGKPQITEQERVLLHWWIASGLTFEKEAKELEQPAAIKTALASLEKRVLDHSMNVTLPSEPVEKASEEVLSNLHKAGITILPVAINSNYLTANLVSVPHFTKEIEEQLVKVKKQLIWLKMPNCKLSDSSWQKIGTCNQLRKLSIEHSIISDKGLSYLSSLTHLQFLNLVDTKISTKVLLQLKNLQELTQIYIGQTNVLKGDFERLQKAFPKAKIDSGGYSVITLSTDTQLVKMPAVKK